MYFIIFDEKIEGSHIYLFWETVFSLASLHIASFNLSDKFILPFHFVKSLGGMGWLPIVRDGLIYTIIKPLYTGIFPCFLGGLVSRLVERISKALIILGRLS